MGVTVNVTEQLLAYIGQVGSRETPAQVRCRNETALLPDAAMQISPEQGAFMAMLTRLTNAKRVLEIGVFTGYSSLSVSLALPEHGKLIALDVSEPYTDRARRYWEEAGVESKIDLRLGSALETLDRMMSAGEEEFDFAFIDADKTNYDNYYERVLKLIKPGGLIALDNMLWSGAVADSEVTDASTVALRKLNAKIHADSRVDMALATVGDGVMLARKR